MDRRKEKVRRKKEENKMKGEIVAGSDVGVEEVGRRHQAQRPQGLLGRGQPISLSLINSSRGDCNTAGDCWEKRWKSGRWRGGGGENEIGMNGKVWRGVGTELEDEEKIGKGGKMGVRMEKRGKVKRWANGRGRTEDSKR